MSWLPDKYDPLRRDLERHDVDPEIREELAHHLESRIAELMASGLSRADAETEARRRFGDPERYRRETGIEERAVQTVVRRRERWTVARHEVKRAWRALRGTPAFSVAAVLTLGVGIGASVAIFTLLDAIVLRPLAYPDAARLVQITHPVPKVGPGSQWNLAASEFFLFQKESRQLDGIGLYGQARLTMMAEGRAQQVNSAQVTASMLALLGARPLIGRLLQPEDGFRGAADGVLLSERFWRTQFGASPAAVGSRIRIEGSETRVLGVIAGMLDLPDWPVDLWLPMNVDPKDPPYNNHVFRAVGRLRSGASAESATRELVDLLPSYHDRFPQVYNQEFFATTGFTTEAVPWKSAIIGGADRTLWVLFAAAGLVLLIAAVNVGNLFLVRSQATRREVAVRSLLGADRGQLAWHHFAESALVSFAALVIGVGSAALGLRAFLRALPIDSQSAQAVTLPRLTEVSLGWRGVWFAIGLALLAGLVFGLIPFLSRPKAEEAVRASRGLIGTRRDGWVRSALVVAQIGFAVVLLASAGLLIRTFERLRSVKPGFEPAGVLVADLALPYGSYQKYALTTRFYRSVIEQVRALPAVVHAAVGSEVPIEAEGGCAAFQYPNQPPTVNTACVMNALIGPDYFTTLGIDIEGRDVSWSDLDANTGAAAMTDAFARRLWPGASAVDRPVNGPNPVKNPPFRIVGVTRDLRWKQLDQDPPEVAFFPIEPIPGAWLWAPPARMELIVKVRGTDPTAIMPEIRRIVRAIDPEVAVERPRTMGQVVSASLLRVRLLMVLLGIAAAAALLLSIVGLYGVIAYTVTRRTREIGVRIAVGAPIGRVRSQIVTQSVWLAVLGAGLGLVGSVAMGRLLATMLYGVSATDPLTLATVAGLLIVVAIVASLRPASRAAAIDPVTALRAD